MKMSLFWLVENETETEDESSSSVMRDIHSSLDFAKITTVIMAGTTMMMLVIVVAT